MDWPKLQELFWTARELPAGERLDYLAKVCAGDAHAQMQLLRMLDADATSDGVLDRTPSLFTPLAHSGDATVSGRVGPYIIGEEIGRGGMGVVYRAYDPRLSRDVALKFLASDRGDREAQARFMKEARTASALDHPHTCPVYDVGSTDDGRFFIAMAFCAGGSLAQRLAAGPLPVSDALRITLQIADALDRAHDAGIVHRDIKPANIAFTERGDARVLDFGIAAFGDDVTSSAPAGTPAYMAPEQLRGHAVDRRTDVWALGVVLYEMLSGTKAFAGVERSAVARAIMESEPADLRTLRSGVPAAVARVIQRALAKDPARRFASAAAFANALRGAMRPSRTPLVAAFAIGAIALGGAWSWRTDAGTPAGGGRDVDQNAVAVLPFRVSGDPSLGYLSEGMVDLLAAKLTGEGGLRAADPRSVLSKAAAHDVSDLTEERALAIARSLGAGHALIGNVVGNASSVIVNASLLDAEGRVIGRGSQQGAHASLSVLVDRLVGELLSVKAGEEPQRLEALTSTSLPALRAYLEGQVAYRRGRYAEAVEKYGRALDFDSTFALAGLGLETADGWVGTGHARERGRAAAWRWRERMSARDRALLEVNIGTAYPRPATIADRLDAAERALRVAPDRPELWYTLGDLHFHYGRLIGSGDWEVRAEHGFLRALELDSAFAAPRQHLIGLYARQRRIADLQKHARAMLKREPVGATADFVRWRVAVLGGSVSKSGLPSFDSLATETLAWIGMNATDDGIEPHTARRALQARAARPVTRTQRFERMLSVHAVALNAGRPRHALALTDSIRESQPDSMFYLRLRVLDGLYGDGDGAAARAAANILAARAEYINQCVAALWQSHRDNDARVRAALPAEPSIDERTCAAALTALRTNTVRSTAVLDELYRAGPLEFYWGDGHIDLAPFVLARVMERNDDRAAALAALRRRPYFIGWQPYLATSLREEGRLAAITGDRIGAFRAYQHFLTLRSDPEPAMVASIDSVRAALRLLALGQR